MINFKVRAKNPIFWAQVFLSIAVPIGAYLGITGKDITTWPILFDVLLQAVTNPYLLFTILVSAFNAVVDPTTKGLHDSAAALTYIKPKDTEGLK